ncbi:MULTISPECIES: hypothetical protein [unclassified Brucella]|uniref:hypothetical protein n=1 Tax=unclassified Brucella TaxID=2632610 RepID=UPI0012ADBAFC|nr:MULTISPECIES: hypothetical protein [unclassified Brucella]MRN44928.1 hypothetical protein [Brucella sp. 09RB8913]MRN58735.1 hypothetical protein [Brucella sp. 09RB8918]CAB4327675.1 hypothetical protein BCH_03100 [Brucella sp. 191011898]
MSDFEVRYNAGELAHFAMHEEIIRSIAKLQGDKAQEWLNQFKEAAVKNAERVKIHGGTGQNSTITETATSMIKAISQAASRDI